MALEQLYSTAESAKQLGVSERKVKRMLAGGELPKTRIGTRVLIRESALAALIDAGTHLEVQGKEGVTSDRA